MDTAASGKELHAAEVKPINVIQTGSQAEWEYFTLTLGNQLMNYGDSEAGRKYGEIFRAGMTVQAFLACEESFERIDVTALLASVSVPVLVVHDDSGRQRAHMKVAAQRLARRIPNARFVSTDDWVRAFREFVREERDGASDVLPAGTATILFTDIVDSTALTERLGDAAFRDKARDLDTTLRMIIRDNAGTAIEGKLLGDGVLAVFTSARQAIEAALACGKAGHEGDLPLHLGLHAGDVIREDNNVYGGAVNIASRISGLSAPGEVLVSDTVRSLARTSASVTFEDRGEQPLKGVSEPVRVWAVLSHDV